MTESIVQFFNSITHNDYLTLFLISIIPIIELRGAIVIMCGMTGIDKIAGMFCCIAGSSVIILPILFLIRPLIRKLKRTKSFAKFGKKMEASFADRASTVHIGNDADENDGEGKGLRRKLSMDAKKFLGLFVFVAVPLPMTGAWTGACAGSFLDFPIWKAALAIFIGNVVAGGILTIVAILLPQQYVDFLLYGFVILALAIAVSLYFAKNKRQEKRRKEEISKFKDKNEYEFDLLKKEAAENGGVLIKREYVDENGDKHIVIGRDANRNKKYIKDDDVI